MKLKLLFLIFIFGLTGCSHPTYCNNVSYISEPEDTTIATDTEEETYTTSEEPKIFEAVDVANYFNKKGEAESIQVMYIEEKDYWYLHYIGEESTDDSSDNLSSGIAYFLNFIPLYKVYEDGYMFRYLTKYMSDQETFFVYVAVSPNWFAACSIYSYIENEHITFDIVIYDGRYGLYIS